MKRGVVQWKPVDELASGDLLAFTVRVARIDGALVVGDDDKVRDFSHRRTVPVMTVEELCDNCGSTLEHPDQHAEGCFRR